jgi:hypothetical protein
MPDAVEARAIAALLDYAVESDGPIRSFDLLALMK